MMVQSFVKDFHDEASVRKMQYNRLGETSLYVSKISIGGGTLSQVYGELNDKEAIRTIHKALQSEINYIDTAPWYGQGKSEELLGEALKDVPCNAYYIGTKVGRYELEKDKMFDFSATKTIKSVDKSLKLLGLDYVDVVQIHDIEFAPSLNIILKETLPSLENIVKQGKAKYIGITGYPVSVLREVIESSPGRFDVVLSYARYTLLDDTLQKYPQFFKEQRIGVICASGHGMGLLTNSGPQYWHPAQNETKEICRRAAEICKAEDIELGKLAMFYFTQLEGPATCWYANDRVARYKFRCIFQWAD